MLVLVGLETDVERMKEVCLEEEAFDVEPEHGLECDLVEKGKGLSRLSEGYEWHLVFSSFLYADHHPDPLESCCCWWSLPWKANECVSEAFIVSGSYVKVDRGATPLPPLIS